MFFFLLIGPVNFTDFVKIMSETLAESNDWGSLKTDVEGYVGIDSIQDQIRKKALKRGFEFNIMVVGEYFPKRDHSIRKKLLLESYSHNPSLPPGTLKSRIAPCNIVWAQFSGKRSSSFGSCPI